MKCFAKMLLTATAGWLAMNVAMLLTFRLIGFGLNGDGVLLDPRWQSPKLIAVWTQLEPLPLVVARPASIIAGLFAFAFLHSVVYRSQALHWPIGIVPRALRLAGLTFGIGYVFWEFFTPYNQFGEPWPLIGLELLFWGVIALAESFAIACVAERVWCLKGAAS